MFRNWCISILACLLTFALAQASLAQGAKQFPVNSVIVHVEGMACMGRNIPAPKPCSSPGLVPSLPRPRFPFARNRGRNKRSGTIQIYLKKTTKQILNAMCHIGFGRGNR